MYDYKLQNFLIPLKCPKWQNMLWGVYAEGFPSWEVLSKEVPMQDLGLVIT